MMVARRSPRRARKPKCTVLDIVAMGHPVRVRARRALPLAVAMAAAAERVGLAGRTLEARDAAGALLDQSRTVAQFGTLGRIFLFPPAGVAA